MNGYEIKEIILSVSETSNLSESLKNLVSISKYPIVFDLTSDKCNAPKNRNRGWKRVTGDWIVFLDCDDYYHLDKLLITYNAIIKNPDIDCIVHSYSYCKYINTDERCSTFKTTEPNYIYDSTFPKGKFENRVNTNVVTGYPITHGIATCRANSKIRYDESRNRGEDGDFCQKHAFLKKLIAIDAVLMDYRK